MLQHCFVNKLVGAMIASLFLALSAKAEKPALRDIFASLEPAIVFELNFDDGSLYPSLSLGAVEPVKTSGEAVFCATPFGRGLLLGGEQGIRVNYEAQGNIDFTRAGAMSFCLMPLTWLQRDEVDERPYLRFFHMQGNDGGYVFIQRQGFVEKTSAEGKVSRRGDMFQTGLYAFKDWKNRLAGSHDTINWKNQEWRFFVLNWQRNVISLSINGEKKAEAQFSRLLEAEDFAQTGAKSLVFSIGYGKSKEGTLLDELVVYNRNLSQDEIRELFAASSKALQK